MKGTSCWSIDEDNFHFPQFKDSDEISGHLHSDGYKHQQPQTLPTAEAAAIGRPATPQISRPGARLPEECEGKNAISIA